MPEKVLVDTDILSYFFRGNTQVQKRFNAYVQNGNTIRFSIITFYEIVSGLKHKDAARQLGVFLDFAEQCEVVPLTRETVMASADAYATLRKNGTPVDDVDLLIAGAALANGYVLITHNTNHFGKIPALIYEDWSLAE
ncbi:MAG: type II toxin-antitoxin system VapC family toxin [Acidobacteriota bacterium]|nr:type II toxin-antitoxin system VapC family toxin [Acidobacteriota bacterium]